MHNLNNLLCLIDKYLEKIKLIIIIHFSSLFLITFTNNENKRII